ncbi:MAG: DUF547 domain-containing protein [Deltaproteobacteria bacterium]|nr:DUF547 domain-containing protein [Deltaproteobacteria bacterium]MBW2340349.1 DUF547 domain-containing protein [Deltaproteobacteria bacterium]
MVASKIREKYLKSVACMGIFSMLLSGICPGILTDAIAETFAYSRYAEFLGRYVVPQKQIKGFTVNVVDYDSIQKNREKPDSIYEKILEQLAAFDPSTIQDREDQIAFWINAYNIGAIKMIIDHYPVDSIRSSKINWLKNPWNKKH